jgi:hypothetical protein
VAPRGQRAENGEMQPVSVQVYGGIFWLSERALIAPLFACSSSLGSEGELLMGIQRKLALDRGGGGGKQADYPNGTGGDGYWR